MAHRTLNPKTAFYGDGRESTVTKPRPKYIKLESAEAIWTEAFPGVPLPYWYGCAQYMYARLNETGYKFNSRKGVWAKKV